ncbi:MAG: hypothetical protein KDA47_25440, partial [Planctomycetales bacterium]|nr:hypothetical protein [Planctomycetales bacterium]
KAEAKTQRLIRELGERMQEWAKQLIDGIDDPAERAKWTAKAEQWDANWNSLFEQLELVEAKITDGFATANDKLDLLIERSTPAPNDQPEFPSLTGICNFRSHISDERYYTPRNSLMTNLEKAINKKRKAAITQTVTVHGLGGVGKSQLALQYAIEHEADFDIRHWIRAEQQETLLRDLADLAPWFGIVREDSQQEDLAAIVGQVLHELSQRDRWLLIYDNAEDHELIRRYTPGGDRGQVLITSRNPHWDQWYETCAVDVMSTAEAKRLLRDRTKQKDNAASERIAERVGCLPLALEIAAAYCVQCQMPLAAYDRLLDQHGLKLLDRHRPEDYHAILSKTWEPSFEQARQKSQLAVQVLALAAFLAPDNIPRFLFERDGT